MTCMAAENLYDLFISEDTLPPCMMLLTLFAKDAISECREMLKAAHIEGTGCPLCGILKFSVSRSELLSC